MKSKIGIIGDGGWGTALAIVLHHSGHRVRVWGPFADYVETVRCTRENTKFLPGVKVPEAIDWTHDGAEAVNAADAVIVAVPSKYYADTLRKFQALVKPDTPVLSVTKGLEHPSGKRMTEVAADVLRLRAVAALSGPSHAEEVARGVPTAVVVASRDENVALFFQKLFTLPSFRVYSSTDVLGVELGGALKNVMAIAAGVSDGLGYGDNTKAALITRGLAEMTRLGCAMGARAETFAGLSGLGDLVVTCTSRHSRNRGVGERIGRGESLSQILASMEQVAEGVWTCRTVLELAKRYGVEMPIARQVHAVLYEGMKPQEAVQALLAREQKRETI